MSTYPVFNVKRSPSSLEGGRSDHGLSSTINPMDIENSHHDFEVGVEPFSTGPPNLLMDPIALTPLYLSHPPQLSPDHSANAYSSGRSSTSSSFFSGDSTPAYNSSTVYSASTAASECSSRRESIAHLEQACSLTSPANLSPTSRPGIFSECNQAFNLTCPATQLSYEGSTMSMQDTGSISGYRHNQLNIGADTNLQMHMFVGDGDLAKAELDLPSYEPEGSHPPLFLRNPTYSAFDESQSPLENASTQRIADKCLEDPSAIRSLAPPFEEGSSLSSSYALWRSPPAANDTCLGVRVTEALRRQSCDPRSKTRTQKKGQKRLRTSENGRFPMEVVAKSTTMPHECFHCPRRFVRQEHRDRHRKTHEPQIPLPCPICKRTISGDRPDNLKSHIVNTHFTPSEKEKSDNTNIRITMKELFQQHQQGTHRDKWTEYFNKGGNAMTPEDIWARIRRVDKDRWECLVNNNMTIHDKQETKSGKPLKPLKPTRYWTMIGWSILEARSIRIKDIAPDCECSADTTLYVFDPRVKALHDGSLSIQDAEHLGVDMLTSCDMGLRHCDPRWIAFDSGHMSLEDAERHGVRHLMPAKRRRFGSKL